MNFNHPFHPLYNPYLQRIPPISPSMSPWLFNGAMPFPSLNYPSPMGLPFPQIPHDNPFMIQQNNFYNSNFTNIQRKFVNPLSEKRHTERQRQYSNQQRIIRAQDEINKIRTTNKNKSKIAEIIELEDSNDGVKNPKSLIKKPQNGILNNFKGIKSTQTVHKKQENSILTQKATSKNQNFSGYVQDKEQKFKSNQKIESEEGGLRRSKRNSEKYKKKIRKIIKEQMGTSLCPRKSKKQNVYKKQNQSQLSINNKEKEEVFEDVAFQRATIPTFLNFQVAEPWRATKKMDLLERTIK